MASACMDIGTILNDFSGTRNIAFGVLFTDQFVRVYKLVRRDAESVIVMHYLDYTYCERDAPKYVNGQLVIVRARNHIETVILLMAQIEAEMDSHINCFTALPGAWDYAAARDVNWHSGPVMLKYYEVYKDQKFIGRYPEEMQAAVHIYGSRSLLPSPSPTRGYQFL